MAAETYYNAEQAVAAGFADEVNEPVSLAMSLAGGTQAERWIRNQAELATVLAAEKHRLGHSDWKPAERSEETNRAADAIAVRLRMLELDGTSS